MNPTTPVVDLAPSAVPAAPLWSALFALTKPRLAAMSVLSTAVAYVSVRPAGNPALAAALFAGTTLAAAGALSFNQWWERAADGVMTRTRGRPLPQHRIAPALALAWSLGLSGAGVALLAGAVNLRVAALGAATIVLYGLVYTPLKRRTRWATEIGAVPGALPVLMGTAAAEPGISLLGTLLFALVYCWQLPHFFAIGWVHRRDYRAAGFPLLPAIDPDGARTARWSLGHAAGLVIVSILLGIGGGFGVTFAVAALAGGGLMLWRAGQFVAAAGDREPAARRLFRTTLAYLPLVFAAILLDRWP